MDSFGTTSDAYLAALAMLLDEPDFTCRPRGEPVRELMNWLFVVERPSDGPVETRSPTRNATMAGYLGKERAMYDSMEVRAVVWAARASKFWAKLANPDGTINSNYGYLVFGLKDAAGEFESPSRQPGPMAVSQWEWAKRSLLADQDTRQAVMHFNRPKHQWFGNRDFVCTLTMMFMMRGNRLHATTVMRSCDVVKGLAYDLPWFCGLLVRMADEVGAETGTYSHLAHSLHLYDRDVRLAEEMLGRGKP